MTSQSYALITPSYWVDTERCRFLVETAQRWVSPDVKHYLVIAKSDVHLFKSMLNSRTEMLIVEDIIPPWMFRIPGLRHFWFSLQTRPVKNWILQQIVKLSVPNVVKEDVLLYADSDMFFIAPFDPRSFERDGKVPLLLETGQRGLIPGNDEWQQICSRLLGLPVEAQYDTNYVGQLIWWRRENAIKTVNHVAEVTSRSWQRAIAPLSAFSEYILYGLYSHLILGPDSGHWHDDTVRTLNYWGTKPLSLAEIRDFSAKRQPHHHSAMISAKSKTSVDDIRQAFS
jgi:Family of unknown function (DUF6492)